MGRVAVLEILEILKSLGTPSLPPSPAEAAAPSQLLHPKSDTGCSGNDFGSRRSSCCHPPLRGARQDLGAVDPHGTTALCQQLKEDGGGLGLIFRVEITESLRLTRPLGSSSSNIRKRGAKELAAAQKPCSGGWVWRRLPANLQWFYGAARGAVTRPEQPHGVVPKLPSASTGEAAAAGAAAPCSRTGHNWELVGKGSSALPPHPPHPTPDSLSPRKKS